MSISRPQLYCLVAALIAFAATVLVIAAGGPVDLLFWPLLASALTANAVWIRAALAPQPARTRRAPSRD